MGTMQRLFQLMAEKKGSDMFMAVGSPIQIKINGVLTPVNQQIMDNATIMSLLQEIAKPEQIEELERNKELNTGVGVAGVGRFRLSAFCQRSSISSVIRFIPGEIPNIDTLGMPENLKDVIMDKRGLVLVVGSTGSGKSTTIASMLDYRNQQTTGHILTLEDPIEFVFKNKKSIVNQREVGTDAISFDIALKNALRQAPDVILIGEIRDKDTMAKAMAYAQSGHLCVATLHANNSYHALSRIISFYPVENRDALCGDMSVALKAIISQRLVKKPDGSRVPAVEVLLNSRHIAELIEKGDLNQVKEAMEKSMSPGSQTFEQCLFNLYKTGVLTLDEALDNADSANNLNWLINNSENEKPKNDAKPTEAAKPAGTSNASFADFTLNVENTA